MIWLCWPELTELLKTSQAQYFSPFKNHLNDATKKLKKKKFSHRETNDWLVAKFEQIPYIDYFVSARTTILMHRMTGWAHNCLRYSFCMKFYDCNKSKLIDKHSTIAFPCFVCLLICDSVFVSFSSIAITIEFFLSIKSDSVCLFVCLFVFFGTMIKNVVKIQ